MVYSVQALAIFTTQQRRDQALNAVEDGRQGRARWDVDTVEPREMWSTGLPALSMQVRYVSEADAQAVWSQLLAAFEQRQPQPGSYLTLHTCTHDEGSNVCQISMEQRW